MAEKTLEELKAENAEAEAGANLPPQAGKEDANADAIDGDPEVSDEDSGDKPDGDKPNGNESDGSKPNGNEPDAEASEGEPGDSDIEDWMDSGEEQSADEIPNAAWKGAREHYKGKLSKAKEEHNAEVDKLKAKVAELENGPPPAKQLNRPKREDFYEHDDPDEAYLEALSDFNMEKSSAKQAAQAKEAETNRQQQALLEEINTGVDQHYERAVKLSKESGIKAETYQAADRTVRASIDAIVPGGGDAVTDKLISDLGAGSEKVFYSLGVNADKRTKLQNLLTSDSSGLKAAMYLGELKAQLSAPQKRKSNAPKPAPHLEGDAAGGDEHKALKKAYDKASASDDTQAAFDARMKARKAGANVSNW